MDVSINTTNSSLSTQELMLRMAEIDAKSNRSLMDGVEDTKRVYDEVLKNSSVPLTKEPSDIKKLVKDHYGNSLEAIGNDDKAASFTNYGFSNDTLNYTLWLALYNDSWVFRRAIDKPSFDEIRCGISLQGSEDKSDIQALLKQHRTNFIQLLQWGSLFGGSIAVMMFDSLDDADYKSKMNVEKIRKANVLRMYVTDRWYGCAASSETVEDMASLDFGKPKYYNITFADGKSLLVHHDYILRYEHRDAPKLIKNGYLQGWGYAEGAHIINELARDDKLKASIQSLVNKSLIEVIKMSGMRGVFMGADKDNENQLRKRLEMVNWGRTFNSLTFLDKEDEYQEHGFGGLGGLSDLLQQNMWLISAALEMQGVLFGDLKSGFANDNEALERYDETINGRCESYLRPVYEKFLQMAYIWKGHQDKVEFTFNSLLVKQQSEKQMVNVQTFIQILSGLLNDGIISPRQYAESLQLYSTKGIIDFGINEKTLKELDNNVQNMMEGLTL